LREVSTTAHATHPGQDENLLRPRGVVRAASIQFESNMGECENSGRKFVSDGLQDEYKFQFRAMKKVSSVSRPEKLERRGELGCREIDETVH
jgi:hypothetical protein